MIKIYLTNVAELPDPLRNPESFSLLPKDRQERIIRAVSEKVRRQQLGAGLILEKVMGEYGVSGEELSFGEHGKPISPKFKFNLSHSVDYVALAVSESEDVGCDIEKLREVPNGIFKKLPEREKAWLESISAEERRRAFFRLWTRRESFLKMTGEGLSGFSEIELASDKGVLRNGKRETCFFLEFDLEGYALCVCLRKEEAGDLVEVQLG